MDRDEIFNLPVPWGIKKHVEDTPAIAEEIQCPLAVDDGPDERLCSAAACLLSFQIDFNSELPYGHGRVILIAAGSRRPSSPLAQIFAHLHRIALESQWPFCSHSVPE